MAPANSGILFEIPSASEAESQASLFGAEWFSLPNSPTQMKTRKKTGIKPIAPRIISRTIPVNSTVPRPRPVSWPTPGSEPMTRQMFWPRTTARPTMTTIIRKLQVILKTAVDPDGGVRRLGGSTWVRREAEATRVSTGRNGVNTTRKGTTQIYNQKSRPPKSTNRTQKRIFSPTKPNVYSPLKTVLKTTRNYTERQQDIHQPLISVLWF